jgi:hypothetical protein
LRIANQPEAGTGSQFSELLKLQSEFQNRIAEETLRYLRRLQGAAAPASPGTVVVPEKERELYSAGSPGDAIETVLEIENRQRVHCMVTPSLSPQVGNSGITWFPDAEISPAAVLLAPDEVAVLRISVTVPANIPAGSYRGALLLQGLSNGAIGFAVDVVPKGAPKRNTVGKPSRKANRKPAARSKNSRRTRRRR